jgi:hypothetical protein
MDAFDLQSINSIAIGWDAPDAGPLHIRAYSLRPRVYYQMDTIQPGASGTYTWPVRLLSNYHVTRSQLGLVAWEDKVANSRIDRLYIPVALRGTGAHAASSYRVAIVPPSDLDEVYLSMAHVGANGKVESPIKNAVPLGYGYYPANGLVSTELSPLVQPGVYVVEIAGKSTSGGNPTVKFYFYRA